MKKILAVLVLSLMATSVWAKGYTIKVAVTGDTYGVTQAQLVIDDEKITKEIVDNRLEFSGDIDRSVKARLLIGSRYHEMILENAEINVEWGDHGIFSQGGAYHNAVYGYLIDPAYIASRKAISAVMKKRASIDDKDREAVEQWTKERNAASKIGHKIVNDYQHKVLQDDYPTLVKFWVLENNYDWDRYDMPAKMALAEAYQSQLPGNAEIEDYINGMKRAMENQRIRDSLAPGKQFKPVVAKTINGDELALGDVLKQNKLVLLEFWASWCGPCRGAFPHLKRAYEEYHDQGFEIYAISIDEDHDDWVQALEEENVPWVNLVDYDGWEAKSARDYAVRGVPASFLITSEGKLLGSDYRGWKLDDALKEYFGE